MVYYFLFTKEIRKFHDLNGNQESQDCLIFCFFFCFLVVEWCAKAVQETHTNLHQLYFVDNFFFPFSFQPCLIKCKLNKLFTKKEIQCFSSQSKISMNLWLLCCECFISAINSFQDFVEMFFGVLAIILLFNLFEVTKTVSPP